MDTPIFLRWPNYLINYTTDKPNIRFHCPTDAAQQFLKELTPDVILKAFENLPRNAGNL